MGNVQKVQRGDCPWKMAQRTLRAENKKVTNAAIIAEIERLAKLNGCNTSEDFGKKFFTSLGRDVKVSEDTKHTGSVTRSDSVQTKNNPYSNPIVARQDTTAPKAKQNPQQAQEKAQATKVKPKQQEGFFSRLASALPRLYESAKAKAQKAQADKINGLSTSKERIIEHNKTNYSGKYYGIVDKKSCILTIYDKGGKAVKSFTVGVGKNRGDKIGYGYDSKDKRLKEAGRYTAPGEFTLDEYKTYNNQSYVSNGVPKIMALKGDNSGDSGQVAIHMVPRHRKERIPELKNRTNTRVSYGCVNLLEEDYDAMHKYLGEGDKIFILPEEEGNELTLNQQNDGSYKFEQKYHKDQKRYLSKEEASKVIYDVRPARAPKTYIA